MENSSNYLREHQIVKFNREASNATKNTKLARVKPARDRDRVGCFNNDLLKQDRAELLALSILFSYSLAI